VVHELLQQAANVLLSCVSAMLPHDSYGSQQEADLAAVAADASVRARAALEGEAPDGYRAVLCAAYGLMQVRGGWPWAQLHARRRAAAQALASARSAGARCARMSARACTL
jgi:hypothetical protein